MNVETTRFGTMAVAEDARVYFPEGLLGFGSFREYAVVPVSPREPHVVESGDGQPARLADFGPLVWLQSLQAPDLAFAVCRAEAIVPNYSLNPGSSDLSAVELDNTADAAVYLIIHRDRGHLVANLRGPLLINERRRLGKQVVINDQAVPLRHRISPVKTAPEPVPVEVARQAV